jgi:hypothetical protein
VDEIGVARAASVWLAPNERVVRYAQAAGETMPANLSEGVFWQRCSNCGGVCCEDARRRGEGRVVYDLRPSCWLVLWRGVCSRGGRCSCQHKNGRSDSGPQRDFHMTTRVTA